LEINVFDYIDMSLNRSFLTHTKSFDISNPNPNPSFPISLKLGL
jgi:hypothetical protein